MALSNPYDNGRRQPGAVGLPLPGVTIRLVSEQGEVITTNDEAGEIQVQGAGVFCEYWSRPEETHKTFVKDGNDEWWFRTGDVASREPSDGHYYRILGRQSVGIIKSGGYKLSALEIESVLLTHEEIQECAVVGLPDDTWGEVVVVAVVTCTNNTAAELALTMECLKEWCRDRMSSYKIPKQLSLVAKLPRNAMGKVQKTAVRNLFSS